MTTQYTTILKLALPVQGELSGTWGDVVNDNITQMVEQAIAGKATVNSWTANSHTLTTADGTTSESRCAILELTDSGTALTGAGTVVCPTNTKLYIVDNNTAEIVTVKTSGGTGVAVPVGKTMLVYCDGTNVVEGVTHANSLSLGTSTSTVNAIDTATDLGAGSSSNSNLPTQLAVKTYVDSQVGSFDTLAEVLAQGNTTGGTNIVVSVNDVISLDDGTNALPSLTTTGDLNTGIYFPSADNVGITTGGTQRVNVSSTGIDVTGSVTADGLTVDGTSTLDDIILTAVALPAAGNPSIALRNTDNNIYIQTGSGNSITFLDSSQNTMLNATPTSHSLQISNGNAFSINSGRDISFYEDTGTTPKFVWDASAESLSLTTVGTEALDISSTTGAAEIRMGNSNSSFDLRFGAADEAVGVAEFFVETGGTERLRIDANGNVGIGTTSPVSSTGYTVLTLNNATNGGNIVFQSNGTAKGYVYNSSSQFRIEAGASTPIVFANPNGEAARIDASGNVGIGVVPATTQTLTAQITNGLSLFGNNTTPYGFISNNHVWATGTGDKYLVSNYGASYYKQYSGVHTWATAPSGTAGNPITFTPAMTLDASGNLGLGITPSAWGSLWKASEIGLGAGFGGRTNGTQADVYENLYRDATNVYKYKTSAAASVYTQVVGNFIWSNAGVGTAGATATLTERMRIDASGNVGIGTSSTGFNGQGLPLVVGSGTGNTGMTIFSGADSYGTLQFADAVTTGAASYAGVVSYNHTDNFMYFSTASTERMRIDANGNVGIGTTSPKGKINSDVGNTSTVGAFSSSGLNITSTSGAVNNIYQIGFGYASGATNAPASIYALTTSNAGFNNNAICFATRSVTTDTAPTERMRIDASGNLMVGRTNTSFGNTGHLIAPSGFVYHERDGGDSVMYLNRLTSDGDIVQFYKDSSTKIGSIGSNSAAGTPILDISTNTSSGIMRMLTSNTERMRIDASGNLLLGGISQINSTKTSIYGSSSTNCLGIKNANDNNYLITALNSSNTEVFRVAGTGDVTNTNNSYGSLSDARLKSNVVDASSQLDDIMAVQVRSYTLDSTGETHIGVIAQELESSGMSGLVSEDKEGMKSVKYSVLYMKAIKAIQEQQATIEALTARIAALES